MKIRLKELRESGRMFQSEMASILHVNQSTVSRMELVPSASVTEEQYNILCEKFGKEVVDSFKSDESVSIINQGNTNSGRGTQYNGIVPDNAALEIIKQQADAMTSVLKKQSEQTDRLLTILEHLAENRNE